jgi:hypothetical protein
MATCRMAAGAATLRIAAERGGVRGQPVRRPSRLLDEAAHADFRHQRIVDCRSNRAAGVHGVRHKSKIFLGEGAPIAAVNKHVDGTRRLRFPDGEVEVKRLVGFVALRRGAPVARPSRRFAGGAAVGEARLPMQDMGADQERIGHCSLGSRAVGADGTRRRPRLAPTAAPPRVPARRRRPSVARE